MTELKRWPVMFALAGTLLAAGACESILDVESPGRIADDDLDNPDAFPALVVGMSYDLAQAMDGVLQFTSLASGELWHGGSYDWGDVPRGIILEEDVNSEWRTMHQARWVADRGIERMQRVLDPEDFADSPLVAQAYVYGGFADRLLGETLCETAIDGEAPQPHTVHFERAIEKFTQAIAIGTAAGREDLVHAAYAGRASVRAWTGDWAGASTDAAQVPVDFVFWAVLNSESNDNDLYYETVDRFEYTVFNTTFAERAQDPRAPWDTVFRANGSIATGANGSTPMFQQRKYTERGADIPLAKGTEMLVLRAEARLRAGDIPGAIELLNEARAFHELEPLAEPASIDAAWDLLHTERAATVWLENRRFWDLRRWFEEGPSSPAYHPFMEGRDRCVPISEEERESNPNIP